MLTVNECSECVNRVRCIYVSIDAKLGSVLYSGSSCQISRIAILEIYSILKNFVRLLSLAVTVGLFQNLNSSVCELLALKAIALAVE